MGSCSSNFSSIGPESTITIEKIGPPHPVLYLTDAEKSMLVLHYRDTVTMQRPDLFHKTMLCCINSSKKMNEIIACQQYCVRDLTQWPKLNKMCVAQRDFIDALIYEDSFDHEAMMTRIAALAMLTALGAVSRFPRLLESVTRAIHMTYLKFGFKPHFLDMWRQQVSFQLDKLNMEIEEDKRLLLRAFSSLNEFIVDALQYCLNENKRTNTTPAPNLQK